MTKNLTHIAFLTPEYPHSKIKGAAGIGTSIKNLVDGLVKKEINVTLFVFNQEEDIVFEEHGICYHLIKHKKFKYLGFYLHRKYIEKYVNRELIKSRIDVIEAPDWTGITAFMNLKVPLAIRFHGSDTYFCTLENRKQKWKNRFFEHNAIHKAKAYIAPTTYAGYESAKLFNIDPKKLEVIHHGLDLDYFTNATPETFQRFKIVNIGTIIRKKGVFQLAEIFNNLIEKYDQAELVFIGSDASDIETGCVSTWSLVHEMLSEKAKERVSYLGKVPYESVKDQMKNAHVCVFPSLAETLGMVTIEAMALQKAVVNTNYGWALELIDHKQNGYLIDPKQIQAYVETISQLFDNVALVSEIGQNARIKIMNTFLIEDIVKKNINFYNTLMAI